jgi:hypothetical protein
MVPLSLVSLQRDPEGSGELATEGGSHVLGICKISHRDS